MRSATSRGFSSIHSRSVTSASSAAYSVALSSGTCANVARDFLPRRVLDHLIERDAGVAEVALGQLVHAVAALAAVERVGHQHGVVDRRDADAVPAPAH